MRRWITVLGVLAGLNVLSGPAQATLIGDTVEFDFSTSNPGFWTPGLAPTSAVVVDPGAEATITNLFAIDVWRINLDGDSILVRGLESLGVGAAEVLTISDLDWVGAPGSIVGVSVSGTGPLADADVQFTADSVTIDLTGGGYVNWISGRSNLIQLEVTHVPEPTTALLLFSGLVGLAAHRRRRLH